LTRRFHFRFRDLFFIRSFISIFFAISFHFDYFAISIFSSSLIVFFAHHFSLTAPRFAAFFAIDFMPLLFRHYYFRLFAILRFRHAIFAIDSR